MRVCLINPPDPVVEDARWDEPLGLLYLGAVLENVGIDVAVIDLNFHESLDILSKCDADAFGIYCSSSLLESAKNVANYLNAVFPQALKIVGGPQATCMPHTLLSHFDKVIIGEGEISILKALNDGPTIIHTPPIENIDEIPFPARHLVPIEEYHRKVAGKKSVGLITARGCPHSCAFCSKVWGDHVRFRSPENIIAEVEACIDIYGIDAFSIRDDTFTLNRKRLFKILTGFKKLNVVWRCLTRVDQVNEKILKRMSNSGCKQIVYGIENGSQGILDNLNKGTTVEQNAEAIRLTKKAGIETKTAVIVGSPGETWDTVQSTIDFIEKNPPDEVIVCVFTPYPGSPVWHNPDKFGITILTRDLNKYAAVGPGMTGKVVIETEEMTATEIAEAQRMVIEKFKELGLIAG